MLIANNLFCCLSQEKQDEIKTDIDCGVYSSIYLNQNNLIEEKNGYRCNKCGEFYPFLTIEYQNKATDPESISKIKGKLTKCKKNADIFCGDHYYARNKKTLQKYELVSSADAQLTDEIPVKGDLVHAITSQDIGMLRLRTSAEQLILLIQIPKHLSQKRKTVK